MQLPRMFGLANWQLLYVIEAIPAVVLGFVVLKVLTDTPRKAHWLKAKERDWLIAKLSDEEKAREGERYATRACSPPR
jgi:MFS transporter, ACS family, tartrate transporter